MDRTVTLPTTSAQAILDTLRHLDEFLRCHATAAVHDELRAFSTAQGWSRFCGVDAFIDSISFTALALHHAIDAGTDHAGTDPRDKETP
jgi:hypothetical protein